MVLIDLFNTGLPQTFNLSKVQYLQSAVKQSITKQAMNVQNPTERGLACVSGRKWHCFSTAGRRKKDFLLTWQHLSYWEAVTIQPMKIHFTLNSQFPPMGLISLRQHIYLWLLWPNGLNYIPFMPSGPFEVWQMDFIQLPCLMDLNMFQSWFVCFLTGSKLSLIGRSLLLPWLKFR